MHWTNSTTSGHVFEWPSKTPIQLDYSPAAMALQMRIFLAALQGKSVTFGTSNYGEEARQSNEKTQDADDRSNAKEQQQG